MSPQLESLERAIADVERAGEEYAKLARQESALQAGRHGAKQEAIKRLMDATPLSNRRRENIGRAVKDGEDRRIYDKGRTGPAKAGSVSAAEKLVETDEGYSEYLRAERDATFDKNMAYTRLLTSRLRALGSLVDAIRLTPGAMTSLLSTEFDLDLVRAKEDQREQTVGGVPR